MSEKDTENIEVMIRSGDGSGWEYAAAKELHFTGTFKALALGLIAAALTIAALTVLALS